MKRVIVVFFFASNLGLMLTFCLGKLNGRYYNEDGTPTRESHTVQKMLGDAKGRQFEEEHRKKMFPPCNIEWKPDSGTVVWCTKRR